MAKSVTTIIQQVQTLAEEIESINVNDSDGWHQLCQKLEGIVAGFPKKRADSRELFSLCLQGLQAVATKNANNVVALIDAVTDVFYAAESILKDGPDRRARMAAAQGTIADILGQRPDPTVVASDDAGDGPDSEQPTLNDIAALLIQVEPHDTPALQSLYDQIDHLGGTLDLPEKCQLYLSQAADKIQEIIRGRVADPESDWVQVGEWIEGAIDEADDPLRKSDPDAAAADQQGSIDKDADVAAEATDIQADPPSAAVPHSRTQAPQSQGDADVDCMPQDADPELLGEFITEGNDLIATAEEALLALEVDPEDMDAVGRVFRAFHTVKGTSAFMELNLISELGHHAESLLSRVRDQEIRYSGGYADLSLRALDMIKDLIAAVQEALGGAPLTKPDGYDELLDLLAKPEAHGISDEIDEVTPPRIGDMLVAQGKTEREQVEDALSQHPTEPLGVAMIKSGSASVTDVGQALRAQKRIKGTTQVVEASVRVSTHRLDRLIDMVGELVIAHSMVAQDDLVSDNQHHELQKKVSHTSKIVRELQDISMSLRMVPLKATFNKMARLVRDVSRKIGKQVNFVTEGEETEIDRNLVDVINDPLVHMVRNAVDHGIEPPDVREKNGKSKQGNIQLSAYHSAGSVVVEIRDDGKGLDRQVILDKARERGLLGDDAEQLSDREVFNLVFEPGFSTAQTVTDVSGRGVGMDVVKKNIESLRGQVETRSELGKGSVFRMSVPLTLAIIDGMVVKVGSESYVIPTGSIVSTLKSEPQNVSTVLNQGEMLSIQGNLIPLFRIAHLYHIDSASQDHEQPLVVVVEDDERRAGLIIDELVGRQQVVIKSLGETMRDIPGISGGAIMPNGRIGLILDVADLLKYADRSYDTETAGPGGEGSDGSLAA